MKISMSHEEYLLFDKIRKIEYFWSYKITNDRKENILFELEGYDSLEEFINNNITLIHEQLAFDIFTGHSKVQIVDELFDYWLTEDYQLKEYFFIKHIALCNDIWEFFECNTTKLYFDLLHLDKIEDQWIEDDSGIIHKDDLKKALQTRLDYDYGEIVLKDYLVSKGKNNVAKLTFDEKVELYCILCPIRA